MSVRHQSISEVDGTSPIFLGFEFEWYLKHADAFRVEQNPETAISYFTPDEDLVSPSHNTLANFNMKREMLCITMQGIKSYLQPGGPRVSQCSSSVACQS